MPPNCPVEPVMAVNISMAPTTGVYGVDIVTLGTHAPLSAYMAQDDGFRIAVAFSRNAGGAILSARALP